MKDKIIFGFRNFMMSVLVCAFLAGVAISANPCQKVQTPFRPELAVQTGHLGQVATLAFSPDGHWLASAGADKKIRVWDMTSGYEWRTYIGADWGTVVAFDPTAQYLVCGDRENAVTVWELSTGNLSHKMVVARPGPIIIVKAIGFSADGRTLASVHGGGYNGNTTKYWDVATGSSAGPTGIQRFYEEGGSDVHSPDDKYVAVCRVGGAFNTVVLKEAVSGKEIWRFEHEDGVRAAAFSPDGGTVATSADDGVIKLWDISTGQLTRELRGAARPEGALSFSSDIRWLATSQSREGLYAAKTKDDSIRIWDLNQGLPIHRLSSHWLHSVSFSPDGRLIAGGGSGQQALQVWSVISGERRHFVSMEDPVESVTFSPDSNDVLAGVDGITAWDIVTGTPKYGFANDAYKCGFSENGRWALCESLSHRFEIWDVSERKLVRTLETTAGGSTWARAVSRDGKLAAASVGGLPDGSTPVGEVTIWDVSTGRIKKHLKAHPGWTWSLAFSQDSRLLYTGGNDDGNVKTWDTDTWTLNCSQVGHVGSVESLATSPDGKWLTSSSTDGTVCLWDTGSCEERARLVVCSGTDDWIVVTPDGLFDGSRLGIQRLVAWRFGKEILGPESFFNEFYYPGLLSDILKGKRLKAPRSFSEMDRRQPQVKVEMAEGVSPSKPIPQRMLKVRIEIHEAPPDNEHTSGSGASDLRLFRNGSLVKVWRGNLLEGKRTDVALEASIPIVAGENRLTAYAFNRDNIKSSDAHLVITGDENLKRAGTAYILAVGIDRYTNPQYNLKYAVADARAFAAELQRQQVTLGAFAETRVIRLVDAVATKANILEALGRLAGQKAGPLSPGQPADLAGIKPAEPEDEVFVYFAGHGTAAGPRFYLIPHDLGYTGSRTEIEEAGLNAILEHSISDRDLEQAFEKIDASRLLLVIDACNSGQALEAEEKRRGPMNSRGLAQLAYEKGMYILTAAQGYQAALEAAQLGHGYLTYALVEEGLKTSSADSSPKDGNIVVREWLDYATQRVPQMQEQGMQDARKLGRNLAIIEGEQKIDDPAKRTLQRPRVFYRREPESVPFIVARPPAKPEQK